MPKQIVITEEIAASSSKLRAVNINIDSAFKTMQTKAKKLDSSWKGAAGDAARSTMYQLFKYNDARSTVLKNYINMLEQQINPGYTGTETVNTKLSDKFK